METAREIFEEMGYIYSENNFIICYERGESEAIEFEKENRKIVVDFYKLTPDEVLATYKQCEELGWIE